MLKRVVVIGFLTGIGQLFSVIVIKWVAQKTNSATLAHLGNIDSMFQLLLNIIGLGLQLAAIRNIALNKEWQNEYKETQSARFTLSLCLIPIAAVGYFNPAYGIFLLAPLLALSGDYALYPLGHSVLASAYALVRLLIPYIAVLLAVVFLNSNIVWFYIAGMALAYLISDWLISKKLSADFLFAPKLSSLLLYVKSLPFGLVNLSLYFIGLGLLIVAPYFYNVSTIAVAFVGLKLYVIVKGVLRIIQQAFLKEMVRDEVCLQVDMLSMLVATTFLGAMVIFSDSTITLFFGKKFLHDKSFFMLLGLALLFCSFVTSMTTKIILDWMDREFTLLSSLSALLALLTVIFFSFLSQGPNSIAWALIVGELTLCSGLLLLMREKNIMQPRLIFLGKCLLLLLCCCVWRIFLHDSLGLNVFCLGNFVLLILSWHWKKLSAMVHQ